MDNHKTGTLKEVTHTERTRKPLPHKPTPKCIHCRSQLETSIIPAWSMWNTVHKHTEDPGVVDILERERTKKKNTVGYDNIFNKVMKDFT